MDIKGGALRYVLLSAMILAAIVILILYLGGSFRSQFSVAAQAVTGAARSSELCTESRTSQAAENSSCDNGGRHCSEVLEWAEADSSAVTNEMYWPRGRARRGEPSDAK